MCIYSVGRVLRSVTLDEVKGRPGSAARVVASNSAIGADDSQEGRATACSVSFSRGASPTRRSTRVGLIYVKSVRVLL